MVCGHFCVSLTCSKLSRCLRGFQEYFYQLLVLCPKDSWAESYCNLNMSYFLNFRNGGGIRFEMYGPRVTLKNCSKPMQEEDLIIYYMSSNSPMFLACICAFNHQEKILLDFLLLYNQVCYYCYCYFYC